MHRDLLLLDHRATADEALADLLERRRALAVVLDASGRPLGVTTLDALSGAVLDEPMQAGPRDPSASTPWHVPLRVADVATPCPALFATTSIEAAATVLLATRSAHAVVVDEHGGVRGVLVTSDLDPWIGRHVRSMLPEAEAATAPPKALQRPAREPLTKSTRGTVLVIEDDADVSTSVCDLLRDEGYDVLAAGNGREALELIRSLPTRPGLVLLDLMMPEMNGWEFRAAQVRDDALAHIPVVVMTAYGHRFDGRELHHPRALLRKPIAAESLVNAVSRHYQAVH